FGFEDCHRRGGMCTDCGAVLGQIIALHVVRTTRPDIELPFRMWLYPIPSLIAAVGWIFVLVTADPTALLMSSGVVLSGVVVYWMRGMLMGAGQKL
ncbi:MAG: hypothetical protein ACKO3V_16705, partial [Pirellula sp.]